DPNGGATTTTLRVRGTPSRAAVVTRMFDDLGRLSSVSLNQKQIATLQHEASGDSVVYGAGSVAMKRGYDHRGRLTSTDLLVGGAVVAGVHDQLAVDGVPRLRHRMLGGKWLSDAFEMDTAGRVIGENTQLPAVNTTAQDMTDDLVAPYITDPA